MASGGFVTTTENGAVAMPPSFPVTRTTKSNVPAAVGVPERSPAADSDSPLGRFPDSIDQEYGGTPPVAAKLAAYAVPVTPAGRLVVVIVKGSAPPATTRETNASTGKAASSEIALAVLTMVLPGETPGSIVTGTSIGGSGVPGRIGSGFVYSHSKAISDVGAQTHPSPLARPSGEIPAGSSSLTRMVSGLFSATVPPTPGVSTKLKLGAGCGLAGRCRASWSG